MVNEFFIALFLLLSIIGTILEILYIEELEEYSGSLIKSLQSLDHQAIYLMFKLLEILTGGIFVAFSLIMFWCGNKFKGAIAVLLGISGALLASFLKICFLHPRPSYRFDYTKNFSCSKDSGFPSGHSLSSGSVCFFLLLHWTKDRTYVLHKTAFIIMLVFIVALDRLYLGAHFLFQVIMGFIYALLLVSVVLHPRILHKIKIGFTQRSCQIYTHLSGAFFFMLSVLVYIFRNGEVKNDWRSNYLSKCNKELNYAEFLFINLNQCAGVGFVLGFILGYHFMGKIDPVGYSKISVFYSMFLGSGLGLVFVVLEYLSKKFLNVYVQLIVGFILRYVIGFLFSYYIPASVRNYVKKVGDEELMKVKHIEMSNL